MRKKQQKNVAPLLLLGGIAFFLIVGLQVAYIVLNRTDAEIGELFSFKRDTTPASPKAKNKGPELSGNVFKDLALQHPKRRRDRVHIPGKPVSVSVQRFSHNIVTGSYSSPATLTIYDDPRCGSCQRQVNTTLQNLPNNLRVVRKFYPIDNQHTEGGLFRQMALDMNSWEAFNEATNTTRPPQTFEEWADLMSSIGIPLNKQRHWLKENSVSIMKELQKDINQADNQGIQKFPAFVINNYLVDERVVKLGLLPRYIERLKNNEEMIQATDF